MKVKVLPTPFSGEEIIQQAVDAANSQLPAGAVAQGADVIRDAAGKVVSVEVNLPTDTSNADLENAKNKINENPGVSKAAGFPFTYSEDLEAVANGATPTYWNQGVATTTSPITGSLSMKRANALSTPSLWLPPSSLDLARYGQVEVSFKLKTGASLAFGRIDTGARKTAFIFPTSGNISCGGVDSGVAIAANTTYDLKVKTLGGIQLFYINGTLVVETTDSFSTIGQMTFDVMRSGGDDCLLDDFEWKVLSGELA